MAEDSLRPDLEAKIADLEKQVGIEFPVSKDPQIRVNAIQGVVDSIRALLDLFFGLGIMLEKYYPTQFQSNKEEWDRILQKYNQMNVLPLVDIPDHLEQCLADARRFAVKILGAEERNIDPAILFFAATDCRLPRLE